MFLDDNETLLPCQHGFQKGLSTAVNFFGFMFHKAGQIDVFYLDFAKAVDLVPHIKVI